jgi:arylsulfatase A-like enzyme
MYVALLFNQFRAAIDFLKPSEDLFLANEVLLDDLLRRDENVALLSEDIIFPRDERLPSSLFLSLVDQWRRFLLLRGIENRRTGDYPLGFPMVDEDFHPFLLEDSTDWLIGQLQSIPQPFFMYYHALPPHEPYRPRREFNGLFEDGWQPVSKPEHIFSQFLPQSSLNQRRLAYDRYVANVDAEFGRIFEALQQHDMLDNTVVILTSDHGQMFERGIHGHITPTLYHPLLHIPLLISLPGQAQRQDVRVGTNSVDILPTIAHLTRRPVPAWTEGELLPPFNENPSADRSIYALETKTSFKFRPLIAGTVALMKGPYKLMRYFGFRDYHDIYEMYDLDGDPEELDDIYPAQVRGVKQMRSEILRRLEKVDQPFLQE